jgi:PAS domain S-box-containing protein
MSAEDLQTILDTAPSAVASIGEDGRIVYWNPQAEAMFGLPRELAIGRPLAETVLPERFRDEHRRGLRRFLETGTGLRLGERRELRALRADRTEFPVVVTVSAVRGDEGWTFHAFAEDVSAQHAAEQERARLVTRLEEALKGAESRFAAVVDSLAEAVTIRDRDDRIFYANRAALDSLGYESIETLRAEQPNAIMGDYLVRGEDGRELTMDDVPSVRLLRGEEPPPLLMNTINRATGEEHWRLLKATGLRDGEGCLEAAITIIEDVTAVKKTELRTRLLAEASEILASSLDYEQTLRNVATLAVPGFADWCGVDLAGERGERIPVAVAHSDPTKLWLAERLRSHEPDQLDPSQGLGRVLRTGRADLYPVITDEMLVQSARSDEHLALMRELGMSSAMIVPLRIGGRTIGAMSLVNAESRRSFGPEELAVAQQIADRAATAVENSRLYTSRSQIAATLQRSLLPEALPEIAGWELSALYRAAGEGMEVGGDFYDAFPIADGWLLLIGDVTGKGVAAAAMTALVRHSARMIAEDAAEPERILRRLDATLRNQPRLSLCSMLCLRIAGTRVTLSSAGHPLALLVGDDGTVRSVGEPGPLLGAFDDSSWSEATFELGDDQALVLYTDGVTDTVGEHGRFGEDRLAQVAGEAAGLPADEILTRLERRLAGFQVGAQADDTAALALRRARVPNGVGDGPPAIAAMSR